MIKLVMTVAISKELENGLDEISRDAWSGEKDRMNQIGRTADRLLEMLRVAKHKLPAPSQVSSR